MSDNKINPGWYEGHTRLSGHGLQGEGMTFVPDGEEGYLARPGSQEGKALCKCGERSPRLPSTRQRKAWHKQHKIDIVAARAAEGAA